MSNFIIKPGTDKIHPGDHEKAKADRIGAERIRRGEIKFKTKEEFQHYKRQIEGNPNNSWGMPPYFPPVQIRSTFARIPQEKWDKIFNKSKKEETE